ncbi:hypothetical protein [Sphingobacterium deserti]|uniref:Uncharacterized protein n=1 Tax=Sphingobacterium deserti TaxID=1229276 RepID=A0A0B8T5T2_9SPHI|nr:hypothetical protein [Sphingobacterium deserti]KGE13109.1 hypothetical protein DI53_3133 [Sphingobacterium deserti]
MHTILTSVILMLSITLYAQVDIGRTTIFKKSAPSTGGVKIGDSKQIVINALGNPSSITKEYSDFDEAYMEVLNYPNTKLFILNSKLDGIIINGFAGSPFTVGTSSQKIDKDFKALYGNFEGQTTKVLQITSGGKGIDYAISINYSTGISKLPTSGDGRGGTGGWKEIITFREVKSVHIVGN